jgi:hypothetical protein
MYNKEMSVTVYHLTHCNIPKDLTLHQHRCENLKFRSNYFPKQPEGVGGVKHVLNGSWA